MRLRCSKIANLLAYASFDGVGFLGFRCQKKKKKLQLTQMLPVKTCKILSGVHLK